MTKQSLHGQPVYDPSRHRMRTFSDVRQAFFDGTDTPTDYLERCLDTIAQKEPTVKAWVTLNEDNARQAAEASSQRYRRGDPRSLKHIPEPTRPERISYAASGWKKKKEDRRTNTMYDYRLKKRGVPS